MFIINIPFMNLDQIYESGQTFRWIKFRDGKYAIPHGPVCLKIEQQKDRFIMNCTDEDFYNIWYDYFDMATDYMNLNYKVRGIDEDFKSKAVRASGVRILKQDLFEIIVSFMLATATNIPNIKRMIEQIAMKCGKYHKQAMRECGQVKWYEFPTYEMILEKQKKLDDSFGLKRKENVLKFCKSLECGEIDLEDFKYMGYKEAKDILMSVEGIGPKVTDCICLYGLHMLEAFPIDTHIKQILKRDFMCEDFGEFSDWYLDEELQQYAGLIQQYIFYNEINPPKEVR